MHIKAVFFFMVSAVLFSFVSCSSFESYLEQNDYVNAEKYCSECEGEERTKCMRTLADSYFKLKDYAKAGDYYKRIGDTKNYHMCVTENAMESVKKKDYETAGSLFLTIGIYNWFTLVNDNANKDIKQLREIEKIVSDYNKFRTKMLEKADLFLAMYEVLYWDNLIKVNKTLYTDAQKRISEKLLKERKKELFSKYSKKDVAEAIKMEKKECDLITNIQKIYEKASADASVNIYSKTAKAYIENYINDFERVKKYTPLLHESSVFY